MTYKETLTELNSLPLEYSDLGFSFKLGAAERCKRWRGGGGERRLGVGGEWGVGVFDKEYP